MKTSFLLALAVVGCASDDDAIRAEVQLVAMASEPAPGAVERVVAHGRRALPSIEAALHTAEPPGRKNLILALRKIGDGDAVPLLRHVALHDDDLSVRREAEWTLRGWAAGKDARGERARGALREVDETRQREDAG